MKNQNRWYSATAIMLTALIFLSACSKGENAGTAKKPKTRAVVQSSEIQFAADTSGKPVAIIETSLGTIKAVLYPEYAPQAVENFIGLAQEGFYNGLEFHRVERDFIIQTGDDTATGSGGTTIWNGEPFAVEVSDKLHHYTGALSMARLPDNTTSNKSQFFIVQSPQTSVTKEAAQKMLDAGFREDVVTAYQASGGEPSLDGEYTVFGQVFEGLDIVDLIAYSELKDSKLVTSVTVDKITIQN